MIEYYTLMHKGSEKVYRDNFFMNFGNILTVLIVFVSKMPEVILDKSLSSELSSLISSSNDTDFPKLSLKVQNLISGQCDYLLIRLDNSKIDVFREGNLYANIIKNGELKMLANGEFSLENDDYIVCGTSAFYKNLTNPAIISDAITSVSCEEWMDNMSFRIADQTGFSGSNVTAVTFIVRNG